MMTLLISSFSMRTACFVSLCVLWVSLTFSKALVEISFVAALIFWVGASLRERQWPSIEMPKGLWIPLVGFITLSVLSHFWSENPEASIRGIFKHLQNVFIFLLVLSVFRSRQDLRRFETVFLSLMVFTVINGFWQYFSGKDILRGFEPLYSNSGYRVSASFKTYGQFAAFLIATIPFLMALGHYVHVRFHRIWINLFYGIVVLSGFILLFFTRSRGAYLAMMIGVFFYLIWRRRFLILLLLGVGLLTSFFALPRHTILHLDKDGKEQSIVERYYLWDRAFKVIQAKPLTGTGINTYASTHAKYDKTQNWRVRDYYAHNGYLQMAAETGIPCLILFLIFLGQYLRFSLQHERSLHHPHEKNVLLGLIVGIISFLFFSFVDTVLHNAQPVMMFWYLLGLQWAYQRVD